MASELEKAFKKFLMAQLDEDLLKEKARLVHKKIIEFDLEEKGTQLFLVTIRELEDLKEQARIDGYAIDKNTEGLDIAFNKCKSRPIVRQIVKEITSKKDDKKRLLQRAATLIRAGQAMRDEFEGIPDHFRSSIETRLKRALHAWDEIIRDEQTNDD